MARRIDFLWCNKCCFRQQSNMQLVVITKLNLSLSLLQIHAHTRTAQCRHYYLINRLLCWIKLAPHLSEQTDNWVFCWAEHSVASLLLILFRLLKLFWLKHTDYGCGNCGLPSSCTSCISQLVCHLATSTRCICFVWCLHSLANYI